MDIQQEIAKRFELQEEFLGDNKPVNQIEPLVSVTTTTYQHVNFIEDCIKGVLMQKTTFPIEFIIGEDGSTDGTRDICERYAKQHPDKIRLFIRDRKISQLHDKNGKFIKRLNSRFNRMSARGKYIALCEGDDYWTDPLKLQKQVEFLEGNEGYVMCWTRFKTLDESSGLLTEDNNGTYFKHQSNPILFDFKVFYEGWHIGMQTLMFRNLRIQIHLANKYKYSRDVHLITELLLLGKGVCLNSFAAVYRKHSGGIYSGSTYVKSINMSYLCYKEIYEKNRGIEFLKLKFLKVANIYIDHLLFTQKYWRALLITLQLSVSSKTPKHLILFFIKMVSSITKSLKRGLRTIASRIIRKQSTRIKIEKFYRRFFPKKKTKPPAFYKTVRRSGINEDPRSPKLIVTITSFPPRIKTLHFTINTLLNQTVKPDMLILWLAQSQFPRMEKDLPRKLLRLRKYGLTIRWCEDLKSYKKLIPALQMYPDDIQVTADDDIFYPNDWLAKLFTAHANGNDYIYCHRMHRMLFSKQNEILPYRQWEYCSQSKSISYLNFFTTGGGAIYPPQSFHPDVLKQELFQSLAPHADDIWFWAMAVLNGTKIQLVEGNYSNPIVVYGSQKEHLGELNYTQGGNDKQLKQILNHYPDLFNRLMDASKSQSFH